MSKIEKDHMCKITGKNDLKDIWEEFAGMVKKPKYACKRCGRVAAKKKNLCKPGEI